jgi:nucleotide-binding universal stress UspA family protein
VTPSTPPTTAARSPSKILVASDLSAAADRALAEADRRARETGAELMVVHAVPHHDAIRMLFPQRLVEDVELAAELPVKARELLEQHVARVCADPERVILRLERGATADEALRVAEEWGAELIVVGAAPDGTADASRIVRHAHVPVLVVRGEAGDGPVVVGTDFSDPALPAVHAAAAEAARAGAPLVLVHALEPVPYVAMGVDSAGTIPSDAWMSERREAAEERLAATFAELGVPGESVAVASAPATALDDEARRRGARLIVVGTLGRTGFTRFLVGSVAETLVRRAGAPVLVVRLHPAR